MESDSEDESGKTYTTLENIPYTEPSANYQLQFEQFVVGERSDDESEGGDEEKAEESDQDEEPARENETPLVEDVLDDLDISPSSQQCILKSEEVAVIESCHHNELKNLLRMNRSKHFMLMQLFKKVKDLLIDCRNDIHSLTKLSQQSESIENQSMQLTLLAAPYFKTKKEMFSSAPNKDTLARRQNGELSIYQNVMTPKWSRNECENLISAVKLTYNHNKQKAILRKIGGLRFKLDKEMGDTKLALGIVEQIDRLEEELKDLKEIGSNDIPPLGKDEFIDWEHISDGYMKDKHTALECRAFWHIYLHPDINKSNWNPEENTKIRELVLKHKQQDWDQIALELGTKRSGFSVCLHYLSVLCEKFSKMRFTKEEDNLILEHVERLRIGSFIPWSAIETFFPNRSRQQLVHRYKYFLSNLEDFEDTAFTDAEDILILILVDRFGRRYSKFVHYLPHRGYMKIKDRYDSNLQTFSTKGSFTFAEDQTLMKYVMSQNFKNVGGLAQLMGRKRDQVRRRFSTLKRFLEKNPHKTLADAPRKMGTSVEVYRKLKFLKCMAKQFKDQADIPTLRQIEEKLGIEDGKVMEKQSKNVESYNVDFMLMKFFCNSYKTEQIPFETTKKQMKQAAETVFDILMKWKVNLIIPDEVKKSNFLDLVDVEILTLLREKFITVDVDITSSVDDLTPPNMNTAIGLRELLKNQLYKTKQNTPKITLMDKLPLIRNKSDHHLAGELIDMMKDMNASERNQIENERCLFLERFISLFLWPAIFSIESPGEDLLNAELGIKNKVVSSPVSSGNRKKLNAKKKVDRVVEIIEDEPEVKKVKLIMPDNREQDIIFNEPKTTISLKSKTCNAPSINKKQIFKTKNDSSVSNENLHEEKAVINRKCTKIIKTMKHNGHVTKNINSNVTNQTKPRLLKIIKVNKVAKQTIQHVPEASEVPLNLRRVERNEVENLLKNKKPITLFMIQKIKMKDGTFKTIRKPFDKNLLPISSELNNITDPNTSSQVEMTCRPQNGNRKVIVKPPVKKRFLADNVNISNVVSLSASVNEECNTLHSQVKIEKNLKEDYPDLMDLKKLNNIWKDDVKTYSKRLAPSNRMLISRNDRLSSNYTSKTVVKDGEDDNKLDKSLKNFHSNDDGVKE